MTSPFTISRFGGLNTIADPQEVGAEAAVSLLNVDTDLRGGIRARDGYSNHTSGAAANPYRSLFFSPSGHLIGVRAGSGEDVMEAIASDGSVADSEASGAPGGFPALTSFANVGTPTDTFTYIAAAGFPAVKTWNGTAFANASFSGAGVTPAGASKLASWKERLVHELVGQVNFSDAGDSTSFGANNFVFPDPGDGETSTGFLTWGDLLFLFRQTKMYVFYGVATDGDGQPIFNYRREVYGDLGSLMGRVVAPDGIYTLTTKGLYRTTGGPMVLVSEQPRGMFSSLLAKTIPSGYSLLPSGALQNRVYFSACAAGGSTLNRTLVFDTVTNDWLLWDIAAQSLSTSRYTGAGSFLVFGVTSGHIAKLDPTVTADAGSAIAWNYTSGLYDLGEPARVKVTLESTLWGTGTVTLQVANDHGSVDTGSAITLGTSPAVAQGWQQIDREGTLWQHRLSGASAGAVHRLSHLVSSVKPVGVG